MTKHDPPNSKNNDRVPYAHEVFDARGVPVRQSNAAMTGRAADGLRIVGAVNADAGSVQTDPKNADEIVRTRGNIVIVFRAHSIVEHPFVVAEPWPNVRTQNFPCAHRRR